MSPLPLAPLEWMYGSIVRYRNARFDRTSAQRLRRPVVSVGNLSVGGSGKTPLVICLARLLANEHPDVLSRGYGRSGSQAERVDPQGSAEQFGDEPLLIAQSAGVPVYVGASRYEAGLLAESEAAATNVQAGVHLLDDGFQHRQLARDLDIVVIHRSDLNGRLLPAGRLREPLSSLKRAGVIVLRQEDGELESVVGAYVRSDCRFWRMQRSLALGSPVHRALIFSAIARPNEFIRGLEAAGVGIVKQVRFRDHHRYSMEDIDRLAALGQRLGCDGFVVTAKDEVKLDSAMRFRLNEVAPLHTAELTVTLEDPAAALDHMRKSLIVTAP
jgi:tetraacyldisaccharide 4'-kinase